MPDFSSRPGFFTVTIDDGTGYPPTSLLAAVTAAVDAMRPIGSQFIIQAPTVSRVDVSFNIATPPGVSHGAVASEVAVALSNYLNSFGLGVPLTWSRLAQFAYGVDPNVQNVTNLLLNGGTADLNPTTNVVLKAGAIAVY